MNNFRSFAVWIVIALLLFALFSLFQGQASRSNTTEIDYSQFLERLNAGDVIVKVTDEEVNEAADVQKRIDQLKKDGKKTALLLVANAEGDVRFVALTLQ